jgi:hypothetical protein
VEEVVEENTATSCIADPSTSKEESSASGIDEDGVVAKDVAETGDGNFEGFVVTCAGAA